MTNVGWAATGREGCGVGDWATRESANGDMRLRSCRCGNRWISNSFGALVIDTTCPPCVSKLPQMPWGVTR